MGVFDAETVIIEPTVRVLLRPGPAVQFGVDPAEALVFPLPDGARPGAVLRALLASGRTGAPGLGDDLRAAGLSGETADLLLEELVRVGLASAGPRRPACQRVTVIGRDAVARSLADALRARGVAVVVRAPGPRTVAWLADARTAAIGTVVVTGMEVPDRPLLAQLWRGGIPHLMVRVRESVGILGPHTMPGRGGCPACADAVRARVDPAHQVLALQLGKPVGHVDPEALAVTVAAAAAQLVHGVSPQLSDAEVTLDPRRPGSRRLEIPVAPDCPVCRGGSALTVAQSAT